MKSAFFALATVLVSSSAFAQTNRQNTNVNTQVGVLPLPNNVNRIVGLEHNNTILAETQEDDGSKRYSAFQLKHISPRALAYIFGATVIPTEALVMPPAANGSFNNGGQNFGFPGGNNGGNNGFNNGFNNGGNNFPGGGNGFMFPQNNSFGNGLGNGQLFNNGSMNAGSFPRNTPFPRNQAGLGIGTPVGNFFVPAQTTN